MTLIAIRHGATKLNTAGLVRSTLDPPMDPEGHKQVAQTAQQFQGVQTDAIHTSNLQRSVQSGKILQQAMPGAQVKPSAALRPWDMGSFAGQKVSKVRKQIDHFYLHPDETPPGSSESYNQFLKRFLPAVIPMIHDQQPHVMVSHNRNMHALEALAAGGGKSVDAKLLLSHPEGNTQPGGVMIMGGDYKPRFYNPPAGKAEGEADTELKGTRKAAAKPTLGSATTAPPGRQS